jgi:superfamily II DNA or RNA helicase
MESNDGVICVAISAIFSTGINIKNIHFILFGSGGKAKTRIVQSIGRGLRLHPTKKTLIIYDVVDNLHYGNKHKDQRLVLYDTEKIKYNVHRITL